MAETTSIVDETAQESGARKRGSKKSKGERKSAAEPGNGSKGNGAASRQSELREEDVGQYVTYYIDNESFAFPLESVLEIIRVPSTVRVPLTNPALLGLANLRGTVLPVIETRRLLGLPDVDHTDASRVIVADCGAPVGLVVDRVERVISVETSRIESTRSVKSTVRTELLTGVVKDVNGTGLMQLLDVHKIIELEFASLLEAAAEVSAEGAEGSAALEQGETAELQDDDSVQLVSFVVDDEEYALEISEVEEIVRVPDDFRKVPRADHHVLGLMNLRDRLLALVSLRRMFGLPEVTIDEHHRVVVANLSSEGGQHESVGIVVDGVREVFTVSGSVREPLPSLLTRGQQLDEFTGVCRLDDGKRLVSILSSDALFHHPAVQAAIETSHAEAGEEGMQQTDSKASAAEDEIQLVTFKLAGEEYGALIETVSEIIRVPDDMTAVPKTPEFIEGLVNLRGTVLPVLDMRVRFDIDKAERAETQRILVLDLQGVQTGFIVDSVTEVLRLPRSVIERSPKMSADQTRIMGRVANLKEQSRMILVLDIKELLTDEELANLEEAAL